MFAFMPLNYMINVLNFTGLLTVRTRTYPRETTV